MMMAPPSEVNDVDERPIPAVRIGERIRLWRSERGWTQAQLAAKAQCSAGTISRIEAGEARPLGRTAGAIAAALGVTPERLLGLDAQADLFPSADERRLDLLRGILALSEEELERAHPGVRRALEEAVRPPAARRTRRRGSA